MQDDKNNPDNYDDLDFEEFDDLDDLSVQDEAVIVDAEISAEDDFSEFDEDWDDDSAQDSAPAKGGKSKIKPMRAQKGGSGAAKLIIPAAVALIALGGGAYYFMGMPNQSLAPADNSGFPVDTASNEMDNVPNDAIPMPSPIAMPEATPYADNSELNAVPAENYQNSDQMDNPIGSDAQASDAGVLTPMPNIASNDASVDTENSPIGEKLPLENISETNDLTEQPIAELDDPALQASDPNVSEIQDAPLSNDTVASEANELDLLLSENNNAAPVSDDVMASEPNNNAMNSDDLSLNTQQPALATEPTPPVQTSDNTDVNTDIAPLEDNAAVTNPATSSESDAAFTELQGKLSVLEQSVSEKENTISALNAQLAALEARIAQQQIEIAAAQEAAKAASIPAAPAETVATPAPKPLIEEAARMPDATPIETKPVRTSPPKATPKKTEPMPKWELRSAQPGKAYIGIVGSNDVLVVNENDTIQGLGRITSISKDSSGWIVKGVNGEIRQ